MKKTMLLAAAGLILSTPFAHAMQEMTDAELREVVTAPIIATDMFIVAGQIKSENDLLKAYISKDENKMKLILDINKALTDMSRNPVAAQNPLVQIRDFEFINGQLMAAMQNGQRQMIELIMLNRSIYEYDQKIQNAQKAAFNQIFGIHQQIRMNPGAGMTLIWNTFNPDTVLNKHPILNDVLRNGTLVNMGNPNTPNINFYYIK